MALELNLNTDAFPSRRSRGVSLLEVLVSMFILLFGLVGVASLFPVGKYHAKHAIQYDQAAAIGQRAFEEIRVRGLLNPEQWNLSNGNKFTTGVTDWQSTAIMFDPLGASPPISSAWVPYQHQNNGLPRLTWRDLKTGNSMTYATAGQIFRSHDDLASELPSSRTNPVIQRISAAEREYQGNYSWAFTAVPALKMGEGFYYVSVVVFRGRNAVTDEWYVGDTASNKLLAGSSAGVGQIRLHSDTKDQIARLRMGEWILLSVPSYNFYKWYKIVGFSAIVGVGDFAETFLRLDIEGPVLADKYTSVGSNSDPMRATFFANAVAVYQKIMRVESDLDWRTEE